MMYQFIYNKHLGWLERLIDIDSNNKDTLIFKPSSEPTKNVKRLLQPEKRFNTEEIQKNLKTGNMIEISPNSQNIMMNIAELLTVTKGCIVLISIRMLKISKYYLLGLLCI